MLHRLYITALCVGEIGAVPHSNDRKHTPGNVGKNAGKPIEPQQRKGIHTLCSTSPRASLTTKARAQTLTTHPQRKYPQKLHLTHFVVCQIKNTTSDNQLVKLKWCQT